MTIITEIFVRSSDEKIAIAKDSLMRFIEVTDSMSKQILKQLCEELREVIAESADEEGDKLILAAIAYAVYNQGVLSQLQTKGNNSDVNEEAE